MHLYWTTVSHVLCCCLSTSRRLACQLSPEVCNIHCLGICFWYYIFLVDLCLAFSSVRGSLVVHSTTHFMFYDVLMHHPWCFFFYSFSSGSIFLLTSDDRFLCFPESRSRTLSRPCSYPRLLCRTHTVLSIQGIQYTLAVI